MFVKSKSFCPPQYTHIILLKHAILFIKQNKLLATVFMIRFSLQSSMLSVSFTMKYSFSQVTKKLKAQLGRTLNKTVLPTLPPTMVLHCN